MNGLSLNMFCKELSSIREYLNYLNLTNQAVQYIVQESDNKEIKEIYAKLKAQDRTLGIDRKVFEYKSTIISLYGLLERYIQIWLKEFLELVSEIVPRYSYLSEKLKYNHFDYSLKLIGKLEFAKYQHLTKEAILSNLHNCVSDSVNYNFNTDAFTIPSGNLKHTKIVEIIKLIDIDLNNGLKINKTITEYIQTEQGTINISNIDSDILYNKINDLVDRRNVIAHGSESINDLLDSSILYVYIEFLEKYCQAIFEILAEQILIYECRFKYKKLDVIRGVWSHCIIGFEEGRNNIKIGDAIIIKSAKGRYFKKEILEIQIDNISYNEAFLDERIDVAIRVSPSIKLNQEFYIIQK